MLIKLSFDSLENSNYTEFIAILFCPRNHEASNGCCKVQLTAAVCCAHPASQTPSCPEDLP